eukprot:CAMPEP_0171912946 /NCGR_PEP_ID=MMETSP0993-20121228/11449_1 /TAXON_ID=483369 /ORGANISM="non described non described, Strain CCMP2098" /LENGTH=163 /DNA_ID=CAMNT_0012546869 /DNA_START=42 /DNA_END=530 /DNA_ORIENTATION=-
MLVFCRLLGPLVLLSCASQVNALLLTHTSSRRRLSLGPVRSTSWIEEAPYEQFDVVVYRLVHSTNEGKQKALGVVLEDGKVQPLCYWDSMPPRELLWDEEEPPVDSSTILGRMAIPVFCEQRQVGGGMGPSNPHGEESEDVYKIYEELDPQIHVQHRPEREIW